MKTTELKYQIFFLMESEDEHSGLLYFPLARQQVIPWKIKDLDWLKTMMDTEPENLPDPLPDAIKTSKMVFASVDRSPFGAGLADVSRLTIIPGYACNFDCAYCYSRASRPASARMTLTALQHGIRSFFDVTSCKKTTVAFTGGGEPCLEPELICCGTSEAKKAAAKKRIDVVFTLTTNGSLINPNILSFLKQNNFLVRISFEVIPGLQNRQRGAWNTVHNNILRLMDQGIKTAVRCVLTPESAHHIPGIIALADQNYPALDYLDIEPAFDPSCPPEVLKVFLHDFRENLFETIRKRTAVIFPVNSLLLRIVGETGVCFCSGEFCILPEGGITWCHRVTPNSELYQDFVFGQINCSDVRVAPLKFRDLRSYGSFFRNEKCRKCFARWNCSGGCALQNRMFTVRQRDIYCDFIRETLIEYLFMTFSRQKEP